MSKFPKEVRERSVRLVLESQSEHTSQWAAVQSVAAKIGCSAQTLNSWVNKALTDRGERAGLRSADSERIKQLERENRELKRSNEILRQASAFFAQAELDRILKR